MTTPARTPLDIFQGIHRLTPDDQRRAEEIVKRRKRLPNSTLLCSFKKHLFGKWFAAFAQRAMCESPHWPRIETELLASVTAAQLQCDY